MEKIFHTSENKKRVNNSQIKYTVLISTHGDAEDYSVIRRSTFPHDGTTLNTCVHSVVMHKI